MPLRLTMPTGVGKEYQRFGTFHEVKADDARGDHEAAFARPSPVMSTPLHPLARSQKCVGNLRGVPQ